MWFQVKIKYHSSPGYKPKIYVFPTLYNQTLVHNIAKKWYNTEKTNHNNKNISGT